MAVTIQIKRGNSSNLSVGTLQEGELGFTTNSNEVFVGDSSTNPILVGKCLSGLISARPFAGVSGRLYYSTDTKILSIDNGSSWVDITEYSQEITQFTMDQTDPPANEQVGVLQTISFSGSNDNILWAQFTTTSFLSDSTDIKFEIAYTMSTSESSKQVSLNADVYIFSDGDDPTKSADVSGQEDEISTPSDTQIDLVQLNNIKVPAAQLSGTGQTIIMKIWRDVDGVTSNHTGDFRMLSLRAYQ